jgi:hypothetical protein
MAKTAFFGFSVPLLYQLSYPARTNAYIAHLARGLASRLAEILMVKFQ